MLFISEQFKTLLYIIIVNFKFISETDTLPFISTATATGELIFSKFHHFDYDNWCEQKQYSNIHVI